MSSRFRRRFTVLAAALAALAAMGVPIGGATAVPSPADAADRFSAGQAADGNWGWE